MSHRLWLTLALTALPLCGAWAQAAPADRIAAMSIEEKAARVLLVEWPEFGLTPKWREAIASGTVRALALQPGVNYLLPEELDRLVSEAKSAAGDSPLLLAAPCEGGLRAPLHPAFGGAPVPEATALGAAGDLELIRKQYALMGAALRRHGVQVALGPVRALTDASEKLGAQTRCFGSDPARVTACIGAAMTGLQEAGIWCAPMALPDASHAEIPVRMEPGMLTVSEGAQADDIEARAQSCVNALSSGAQLVRLVAEQPDDVSACSAAITRAVEEGALPVATLDAAVLRVLVAAEDKQPEPSEADFQPVLHTGVVIVRDNLAALPLKPGPVLVINPGAEIADDTRRYFVGATLGSELRDAGAEIAEVRMALLPTPLQREAALRAAQDASQIVVAVLAPQHYPEQRDLVEALLALGKPVTIVSLGNPDGLEPFADAPVLVAANGFSPISLRATARVLLGEVTPTATLPAPIGRRFPAGHREQ